MTVSFVNNLDGWQYSHQLAVRVAVIAPALDGTYETLRVIDRVASGTVSLDSQSAARGRLDLSLSVEPDSELIPTGPSSLLAPFGNELRVSRGITRGGNQYLVRLGTFGIETANVDDNGDSITISISGPDRSWHFTETPFETPGSIAAGTQADEAIAAVLTAGWAEVQMNFMSANVALPTVSWEEGEDRWAFAQGIATAIGGELYFDDNGICVLRPVPSATGEIVAEVSEGDQGSLMSISREWDRNVIFNRVIVTGENTSEDGDVWRAVATDSDPASPTRYDGPFGKKPYFYDNEFITSNEQAGAAASGILQRVLGAPDVLSFGALVDPNRRPGDLVRLVRERVGVDQTHLLDEVSIPLEPEGQLTGRTRIAQELQIA